MAIEWTPRCPACQHRFRSEELGRTDDRWRTACPSCAAPVRWSPQSLRTSWAWVVGALAWLALLWLSIALGHETRFASLVLLPILTCLGMALAVRRLEPADSPEPLTSYEQEDQVRGVASVVVLLVSVFGAIACASWS